MWRSIITYQNKLFWLSTWYFYLQFIFHETHSINKTHSFKFFSLKKKKFDVKRCFTRSSLSISLRSTQLLRCCLIRGPDLFKMTVPGSQLSVDSIYQNQKKRWLDPRQWIQALSFKLTRSCTLKLAWPLYIYLYVSISVCICWIHYHI